jgi:poly-gamma-glutamate synthesis protein (capsule biosynthesis protein)
LGNGDARAVALASSAEVASATLAPDLPGRGGETVVERTYAVVVPFDTIRDEISLEELRVRWSGAGAPLYATEDAILLTPALGRTGATPVKAAELMGRLRKDRNAVGIVPFELLDPTFKVLRVDGVSPLDNRLVPGDYPLTVDLKVTGDDAQPIAEALRKVTGATNRDPSKLTSLIMTGVTAMSRNTAARMAEHGVLYPALVISDTLSAADITHVSNEVPFLGNCKVNATKNNLVLCSHTSYWEALNAIGTDLVGLSGNHVNDFGRKGARSSIQFYRDNKIPIYGSGLNEDEACAPLLWEHNGNTFAFVAALAYWPESAWATADQPGACYYYNNKDRLKALVEELSEKVDVVAVELQYYETYEAYPTLEQVKEFREVRDWGAELVTGVQSHVPQAMEPYGAADDGGPGGIAYGLGNLFFDQMWSWDTRSELYARHTIYDGKIIGTEILTGVLEDFAQPRWATPKERAQILTRIFDAAPGR